MAQTFTKANFGKENLFIYMRPQKSPMPVIHQADKQSWTSKAFLSRIKLVICFDEVANSSITRLSGPDLLDDEIDLFDIKNIMHSMS